MMRSLARMRPSARGTNLALLTGLVTAFATGIGTVATGSPGGWPVAVAHGLAAAAVIVLIPWKSRVVRHGLRRARPSRWLSLMLAVLAAVTLLTGLASMSGLVRSIGGTGSLWLHIAAALGLVPALGWHVLARRARPYRHDLSRRTVLRAGAVSAAAAGGYLATASLVQLLPLPGAARRFTGSYQTGSFDPAAMPVTSWLDDTVPDIDPARWRLTVVDAAGRRELTLPQLTEHDTRLRATLDCTSGWYAHQDWTGAPVSAVLRDLGQSRSLLVRSVTGYWIRFPVRDIDHLLLATGVGGRPLLPGNGYPLRLVAPHRRGFWWVKWISRIELQRAPWWWQSPFPTT